MLHRVVQVRQVFLLAAFRFEATQHGVREVHVREHVGEAAGQGLAPLQVAAEHCHGHIGHRGEGSRRPRELAVVLGCGAPDGRGCEEAAGQREHNGARHVAHHVSDVSKEGLVEGWDVVVLDGHHLVPRVGVTANGALAEDDQRAGEDVGTLDRDADRRGHVGVRDRVARAERDRLPAQDVHAIVDAFPSELGEGVLGHGGHDGGLSATVEAATGRAARGLEDVGLAADARQGLLDAFELADGHAELLAHRCVGTGHASGHFRRGRTGCGERNPAARRQALHEHTPALANAGAAADDDLVELHFNVLALRRAVVEGHAERVVAPAEHDALCVGWDQRTGDAAIFAAAEVVLGVTQSEGEA